MFLIKIAGFLLEIEKRSQAQKIVNKLSEKLKVDACINIMNKV